MRFRPVPRARNDLFGPVNPAKLSLLVVTAVAGVVVLLGVPAGATAQGFNRVPAKDSSVLPSPFPAPPVSSIAVNRPDVLDLEPAVTQAELILAVRLVDVT
jgi:hypothetical protein